MRWFLESPNRPDELRRALAIKYPDLHFTLKGEIGWLRGSFPVMHQGQELDRFQVEIQIPPAFPRAIPVTRETAHRIPQDPDWHVYSGGGLCTVVPEEWFMNPQARSVMAYLDGPLRNFFISHALVEAGQPRPMGERSHGAAGLLEAYGEMVGESKAETIIRYLDYCSAKKLKRHWSCPCGSGIRVAHCHLAKTESLRDRIPRWIASSALRHYQIQIRLERSTGA